jgi:hypothetical protein
VIAQLPDADLGHEIMVSRVIHLVRAVPTMSEHLQDGSGMIFW